MGFSPRSGILFLVALTISTNAAHAAPTPPQAEAPSLPVVFVDKVRKTALFEMLTYPARVVSKVSTVILAESEGIVKRIHSPLGQHVMRRERLMTIAHTDPVYQYAPLAVTAPAAGVVSLVDVTEGSQVTKGQRLAIVTDPAQVRLTVEVPAQDLAALKKGMTGEFKRSNDARHIPVKVRGISPFVDPATGTATCELEFDVKATALQPGLLGQVIFKANEHPGISIPDHAVVYRASDTFVRVIQEGKAKQVAIKLGRKDRGNVEILQGLEAGSTLVMRSSRYIADGEAVTIQQAESTNP